jgi:hypothetical protein
VHQVGCVYYVIKKFKINNGEIIERGRKQKRERQTGRQIDRGRGG